MPVPPWVIVDIDTSNNTIRLLEVDKRPNRVPSARKNLPRKLRIGLYHPLEDAVLHCVTTQKTQRIDGQDVQVYATPVLSPYSSAVVGAYGIMVPAGQPLPPPPQTGVLEWRLGGGQREIYWDEGLVGLYGMRDPQRIEIPGVPRPLYQPGAEWPLSYIESADQDMLQKLIASASEGPFDGVVAVSYGIRIPGSARVRMVEMTARNERQPDGSLAFYGMVREVRDRLDPVIPPTLPEPPSLDHALVEITRDIPMAQIRYDTGELVQAFPGWEAAGLPSLRERHLREFVAADRQAELVSALENATRDEPVTIIKGLPIYAACDKWVTVDLWVKSVGGGYLMIRAVAS